MKQYPKVTRPFPDSQPALIRERLDAAPVSPLFGLLVLSALVVSVGAFTWWATS